MFLLFGVVIFAALYMHARSYDCCVYVCCLLQYYRKARSLSLSRTHPELFKEEEGVSDDQLYLVSLLTQKSIVIR